MKIGPPLVLPLLRRRGRIIWYSEQGLHGRICIFVARSILFSLVFPILESKAKKAQKKNPSLCLLRSSCLLSSLCLHQVLSKVAAVFLWVLLLDLLCCKKRVKKEQKKRRESVEQVCNHFQLGEKFQKLKWQVLQLKRGARIYKFFLFIWFASIGSQH